jgi:hypothetical protein
MVQGHVGVGDLEKLFCDLREEGGELVPLICRLKPFG